MFNMSARLKRSDAWAIVTQTYPCEVNDGTIWHVAKHMLEESRVAAIGEEIIQGTSRCSSPDSGWHPSTGGGVARCANAVSSRICWPSMLMADRVAPREVCKRVQCSRWGESACDTLLSGHLNIHTDTHAHALRALRNLKLA